MKNGSCLCGGVSFEVASFIPHTTNCFCSMCRKFHGAAYATFGVARISEFNLLSGHTLLNKYKSENGAIRTFCNKCGSSLFYQSKETDSVIDVALGAMDDEPGVLPEVNIYTDYKAGWIELSQSLPSYEEEHDLP